MLLHTNKLTEKIEHYQSFVRNKTTKSGKKLKIITYQPKTFENPNIAEIKPVIIEHPKMSHELSKTIRQAEKLSQVSYNSSLYSNTKKKNKNFLNKKNVAPTKRGHSFKDYASSYDINTLNSFNSELQLKIN